MRPVFGQTITDCPVCGDVGCERDLVEVETEEEAAALYLQPGDLVCRECAEEDEE